MEEIVYALEENALPPRRANVTDSGYDLYSYDIEDTHLNPGDFKMFRTGVKFALPEGWEGIVKSRSGLASKGIQAHPGLIDETYRKELMVILYNIGKGTVRIQTKSRIAQICFRPKPHYALVMGQVEDSDRGGFGSTGDV